MCFVLYSASRSKPPPVEWNPNAPAFHTEEVIEEATTLRQKFTLSNLIYLGSDQSCGCGFRHALLGDDSPVIQYEYGKGDKEVDTQSNHDALANYLKTNFGNENFIELYGCTDTDLAAPIQFSAEIIADQINQADFFFRERGFYKVLFR